MINKKKPGSRTGKKNYKSSRNSRNDRDVKVSSRDVENDTKLRSDRDYNDPSWYNASNQLVIDACSIGFATPLGVPLEAHGKSFNVPGIMRLDFVPSIGLSQDNTSPVNMSAQAIYSYVNYANSRNTSYDRTDMMLFLLAMDSAYSYLSFLKRIYGIARLYSATNRYLPTALLSSMNVEADSILYNLNDLRGAINLFAAKLGSFFVPATFTYLQRHAWMNYNVFSDSDKPFKSQLYYYQQQAYYKYNETTSPHGTSLIYTPFPAKSNTLANYSALISFGNELLNPLLNSQDIGIMGSDMLKAFGENGLIKLNAISDDFTIDIAYSPEVLTQIQNTIAVGDLSVSQHLADITQDNSTGYIIQTLKANATSDDCNNAAIKDVNNYFLNMPMVNPSPDNVMVATRNMSWVDSNLLIHGGSDVITHMNVFDDPAYPTRYTKIITSSIVSMSDPVLAFQRYGELLKSVIPFNMHPRLILGAIIGSGADAETVDEQIICDFENYTPLPIVDLQKMHEVALLSMFNVPQYGTYNG